MLIPSESGNRRERMTGIRIHSGYFQISKNVYNRPYMADIVQRHDPVLRKLASEVPPEDITKPIIKHIIADMKIALDSQIDGVALAAPQIAVPLRIFIISGKVFNLKRNGEPKDDKDHRYYPDIVFVNPRMVKLSKDKKIMEEGCLSVRYAYGKTERSTKETVEAYDANGKKFSKGASGLMAQIFQHEMDHLEGKLFIDNAFEIKEMPPEHTSDNDDDTQHES